MKIRRKIRLLLKALALRRPDDVARIMRNKRLANVDTEELVERLKGNLPPESFLFITLDSCRYDIFKNANCPNLKAIGPLHEAGAPAHFTFASHAAMFVGITPGVASSRKPVENPKAGRMFRLVNAISGGLRSDYKQLRGRTIIEGFKNEGFYTLGVAAMRWLDPKVASGQIITGDFEDFHHTGTDIVAQVNYLLQTMAANPERKYFTFINVGETHVPYWHKGADWPNTSPCLPFSPKNDAQACKERQTKCLEYVDEMIAPLLEVFREAGASVYCCADHGDCHGEDGLWGHGFYHEKVMTVPMLFNLREMKESSHPLDTSNEEYGVALEGVDL